MRKNNLLAAAAIAGLIGGTSLAIGQSSNSSGVGSGNAGAGPAAPSSAERSSPNSGPHCRQQRKARLGAAVRDGLQRRWLAEFGTPQPSRGSDRYGWPSRPSKFAGPRRPVRRDGEQRFSGKARLRQSDERTAHENPPNHRATRQRAARGERKLLGFCRYDGAAFGAAGGGPGAHRRDSACLARL